MFCNHDRMVEITCMADAYRHFKCMDCGFVVIKPFWDLDDDAEE